MPGVAPQRRAAHAQLTALAIERKILERNQHVVAPRRSAVKPAGRLV